jgi:hypothetical protein
LLPVADKLALQRLASLLAAVEALGVGAGGKQHERGSEAPACGAAQLAAGQEFTDAGQNRHFEFRHLAVSHLSRVENLPGTMAARLWQVNVPGGQLVCCTG